MARYLQGINGVFIGKIGAVVGCVLNGTPYMRGKPKPRTGPVGTVEQGNRNKFSILHDWLQPLLPLLRVGFKNYSQQSYGYNAAKSYNLKHAMIDGNVLPEDIKLSMGDLPRSADLNVRLLDADKLLFQWNPAYLEAANYKDQIMVLAYHPESRTPIYELHGAFRETGSQVLRIFNEFAGKTIELYAAFISADRNSQSESVYLGAMDC
jgi:hypothetical protein